MTVIPVPDPSVADVLYESRVTRYRFEVLTHDPVSGNDTLAGFLDGVTDATVQWSQNASVKGSGSLKLTDLAQALPGTLAARDINLVSARIRPVLVVEGLPEVPLSTYVITAAPESWTGEERSYGLELHDKATVLDQDRVDESFTADVDQPILLIIRDVIRAAGETIHVDESDQHVLINPLVWEAGTSRLAIVNDLLDALGYNSLWVDGRGAFRATPYIRPADRPIAYDIFGDLNRELLDGSQSIYLPDWSRDRDSYDVPNKVVAVSAAGGDEEPLIGIVTNEDPTSPYSYQARGRWVVNVLTGVEVPDADTAERLQFLIDKARQTLIAASAVQAAVKVKHLPLPLRVGDVLRFRSAPAGIDTRHVVTNLSLECKPTGLMTSELQEVLGL